jgi:hypothetical protein
MDSLVKVKFLELPTIVKKLELRVPLLHSLEGLSAKERRPQARTYETLALECRALAFIK